MAQTGNTPTQIARRAVVQAGIRKGDVLNLRSVLARLFQFPYRLFSRAASRRTVRLRAERTRYPFCGQ